MTCILCFDPMDMIQFNDPGDSTTTCVKLSCGHAFHTKCIITCLEVLDHKCPLCNSRKSPEKILTEKGVIIRTIKEVRKLPQVKELLHERKVARDQVIQTMKNIRKQTEVFAQQKAKELNFFEQRSYYLKCKRAALTAVKVETQHLKPLFTGVIEGSRTNRYGYSNFNIERTLFGACPRFEWRIMYPRCYVTLKNLKEK